MLKVAFRILMTVAMLFAGAAHAQTSLMQSQTDLVSAWLVIIDGEAKTRTLRIKGVAQKADQSLLLDADYGFSDGKQTAVKAEMLQVGQERQLMLTTQADSKIVATQQNDGSFVGTFTPVRGVAKSVRIDKRSEAEIQSSIAAGQRIALETAINAAPVIEPPAADVPAACAAFLGGWSGIWPTDGRTWLWVVAVDARCVAKYAYGRNSNVPKKFLVGEIKDGVLTVPVPSGADYFEIRGGDISGRYSGSGGTDAVMMQKVSPFDGSLAKLRAEQKTAELVATAPAADAPAACASLFGGWTGVWSLGGFGPLWLRVVSVDANCIARISYRDDDKTPRLFESVEIKKGVLTFLCNKSTQGICNFERHGDDLFGSYRNPFGGTNSGVFHKTN